MDKYYKKGFYIVIIVALIGFTYLNYLRVIVKDTESENNTSIDKQRLVSFSLASSITGKIFPDINLIDAVELISSKISFAKPVVIIMLSDLGCSTCQVRELEIYQQLYAIKKN